MLQAAAARALRALREPSEPSNCSTMAPRAQRVLCLMKKVKRFHPQTILWNSHPNR